MLVNPINGESVSGGAASLQIAGPLAEGVELGAGEEEKDTALSRGGFEVIEGVVAGVA